MEVGYIKDGSEVWSEQEKPTLYSKSEEECWSVRLLFGEVEVKLLLWPRRSESKREIGMGDRYGR